MVLEERIPVDNEGVAKEVVQYLKKEGVTARITTEQRMSVALILSGKYENLRNFIKNRQEKSNQGSEDQDHEVGGSDTNNETGILNKCLAYLEAERESIIRLLDEHKPGDLIGVNVHRIIFLKEMAEQGYDPDAFAQELATIRTLMSNKVCEISEGGFILTKPVNQEEIILYVTYDFPFPPEQDVCNEFQITCIRHFRGDIRYVVHTGPEIIHLKDFEAFLSELSKAGVDLRSMMNITRRFMSKLRITQEVINQVFNAEEISQDDLRLLFVDEIVSHEGDGPLQDRFGLSPEFIDALVSDMRKLNLIKGKDARLKPVNLSEKKSGKKR